MLRGIESRTAKAGNPYRQILRRHVPEPVLALLIFVMGVWLWDNHFGAPQGYEDGTCQIALIKIDRDLRLAEGMEKVPPLLRSALLVESMPKTMDSSIRSLAQLAKESAMDQEGAYALAMLQAVRKGENPSRGAFGDLGLPGPPDPRAIIDRVAEGHDAWWDREYLTTFGDSEIALKASPAEEDLRNHELALRVIVARGAVWLFAIIGLFFVPRTLRAFARALRSRERGYVGQWPLTLGLGIFFMAYLASVGFESVVSQLLKGLPIEGAQPIYLEPPVLAILDTAVRFLPAMVALGFLFRRGRHAMDRLGLAARPDLFLVLGSFSLLTLFDQILQHLLADTMPPDPTGGLSAAEAGPWGLVLAVVSACIAAPVAEEILYRGVLFRSLANWTRVPAGILISSVVFALVHYQYEAYGLLSVGILGAACALCYAATGRLATAILLHMLYNFVLKVPEWIVYHAPL